MKTRASFVALLFLVAAVACSTTGGGQEGLNPYSSGESAMTEGAFSKDAAADPDGGGGVSSADNPM